MEFNQDKVNEGRFLSRMGLEKKVLADGVMPNSEAMDRFSLVKGILEGYFDAGDWENAVNAVYTEGGPVRTLFDGDWDYFKQRILETAQQKGTLYGKSRAISQLRNDERNDGNIELLYQLATTVPRIQDSKMEEILNDISEELTSEQRQDGYNLLAEKAFKDEHWGRAVEMFEKGGNEEGKDRIYHRLVEEYEGHDKLLLELATFEDDDEKEKERLQTVLNLIYPPITDEEPHQHPGERIARTLRHLAIHHDLDITLEQEECLTKDVVDCISRDALKEYEPELVFLWAKKNIAEYPKDVYLLFKERNYQGPEVMEAVLASLQKKNKGIGYQHNQKLYISQIDEEHRQKLLELPETPLDVKLELVDHDKNYPVARELSLQYEQQGDLGDAYRVWVIAEGDLDSPYVQSLRERLVEKELAEAAERRSTPVFHTYRKDPAGIIYAYDKVIDTFPHEAFRLAKVMLEDEERADRARKLIVERSPEEAFRKFSGRIDDYDERGVGLVLTALAEKYEIPKETVEQYLKVEKPKS